jgi:DNA-binding transcriptional regulator YiaG
VVIKQYRIPWTKRLLEIMKTIIDMLFIWPRVCSASPGRTGMTLISALRARCSDSSRDMYATSRPTAAEPKRISHVRTTLNLTQTDLAQLLGVHTITVSKWERDVSAPTPYQRALLHTTRHRADPIRSDPLECPWIARLDERRYRESDIALHQQQPTTAAR